MRATNGIERSRRHVIVTGTGSMRRIVSWTIMMLLVLATVGVAFNFKPVRGQGSLLDSMWVSPSAVNYSTNNATVGTLFNLTVWANMENGTYDWQVTMNFNASLFQEVACGYTDGSTSAYFAGHTTVPVLPVVDNVAGSILFGESLIGPTDYVPEENASLMFAEFNITSMPASPTPITGIFDINATGIAGTFFDAANGTTIVSASNLYDATFTLPQGSPPNSIWVSPSTIDYNTQNAGVGTLFNVTVWAYCQNGTYDWQVTMNFSPSVFQCVECGYTDGATSAYFAGHQTLPISPWVNNSEGIILFGEALIGATEYAPEEDASLMFAEFNITSMPTATTTPITGLFDINTTGTNGTFFDEINGNNVVSASNLYDASFTLSYVSPQGELLNSIWVSPSTIGYSTENASVGTLFNVTVWAYCQNGTFDWQVTMNFDASVFQCVICGYSDGATSAYFAGHTTVSVLPVVDNVAGSILFGESLLGNDYAPGEDASLMFAEFNITSMPTAMSTPITGLFDINATGTSGTFVSDTNGNNLVSPSNICDATFTLSYLGPPAPTPNSIWVSPSTIYYTTQNASVGTLFNVTVWAYCQNGTYDWQVSMNFNSSVLQCVACGYTDGATSAYFAGHTTVPVAPYIDNTGGIILFGESLIGNDYAPQENTTLMYAEFNITSVPNAASAPITGLFNINATTNQGTFFDDTNGNSLVPSANIQDATFTVSYAAPIIIIGPIVFLPPPMPYLPGPVTLSANVTDNSGTGIVNVTIVYSNDNWLTNLTAPMTLNTTTGFYIGIIPADALTNNLSYAVQARDNGGGFAETVGGAIYQTVPEYQALSFVLIMIAMLVIAIAIIRRRSRENQLPTT